jgi:hypothetical protein
MIRLPRFYGLEKNRTEAEREAFVRVVAGAGYDPVGVAAVIETESAGTWDPSIRGPSGAFSTPPGYPVGLLQFAPDTAKMLGTSTYQLESMSFLQQLPYVTAYYAKFGGPSAFSDPGDYYCAGWGTSPRTPNDKVLATAPSKTYNVNKGLDLDGDGVITAGELRELMRRKISGATSRGMWEFDVSQTPSMTVRVSNPQGVPLGVASVAEADAVGAFTLAGLYGPPTMVVYPDGIRVLNFAPGVSINARKNLPYQAVQGAPAPGFSLEHAGLVMGIAGLAATIFYGTINVHPGRRHHAR